jgi:hypothetical protein
LPRAVKTALRGSDWNIQPACSFFRRKTGNIPQDQNLAIALRQIGNGAHQIDSKLFIGSPALSERRYFMLIPLLKVRAPASAPKTLSPDDLEEPSGEGANCPQRPDAPVKEPESVLHRLFDIVRRALAAGVAAQLRPAPVEQFQQCFFASSLCRSDEIVRFRHRDLQPACFWRTVSLRLLVT